MAGWSVLVVIAAVVGPLVSPALGREGVAKALEIYAEAAADDLDGYARKVAGEPVTKPAAAPKVTSVRGQKRGLIVNNESGRVLDFFVYLPGAKPRYLGKIQSGQSVFMPCQRDNILLAFTGPGGYRREVQRSFTAGSVGEVQSAVLSAGTESGAVYYGADREEKYSYIDVFGGRGAPGMSLEFSNPNNTLYLSQLGIGGADNGPYNSLKWDKLKTKGFGLVGVRYGGYGSGNLGGAFEVSMEKRNIARQMTTANLNGGDAKKFTFGTADYLTVTSVYAVGNIMFRFPKRTTIEPYVGVGGGFSFNSLRMPRVAGLKDSSSSFLSVPTKETTIGFVYNIPCGVRVRLTEKTQMSAEARYQVNQVIFDRGGIAGEKDTLTVRGVYFNLGLGFNF